MKKRLTAWLLVFCMTLSLLPGTAFAAENTGSGDGTVTITYDLNDNISDYQLQLTTTAGHEPANQPRAKWAGRPFLTWTSDRAGQVKADYSKDTTLYAQWQSGYKVTIEINPDDKIPNGPKLTKKEFTTENNGKLNADDVADINRVVQEFERGGKYAFDGWYTDKDCTKPFGDITGTITENGATLYAKWIPIYHIKFIYNNPNATDGTSDFPTITKSGGTVKDIPAPPTYKNDPYTFEGWYIIEPENTSLRDAQPIPSGSKLAGAGSGRGIKITQAELSSFSFIDAAEDLKKGTVNAPIEVQANWAAPYGIIFDANGGHFGNDEKNTKTTIKTSGSNNVVNPWPADPTREGEKYKFIEWRLAKETSDGVTGDTITSGFTPTGAVVEPGTEFKNPVTVYAKWQKRIHVKIDYDTTGVPNEDRYLDVAGKVNDLQKLLDAAKNINRPGWLFDKWDVYNNEDGTGSPDETLFTNELAQKDFSSDTVLKPHWVTGSRITFDANGGAFDSTVSNPYITDVQYRLKESEAPKVNRPGYDFKGWYTTPDGRQGTDIKKVPAPDPTDATKNIYYYEFPDNVTIVYAIWGPEYTITLDPDGGTMTIGGTDYKDKHDIQSINDGKYPTLPTPTQTGKKWLGWYRVEGGVPTENRVTAGGTLSGPVELIAKWDDYTITFDPNGGSLSGSTSPVERKTTDGKITVYLTPVRQVQVSGATFVYPFLGWFDKDGNELKSSDIPKAVSEDTTYTARWGDTPTPASASPTAPINANKAPNKVPAASKPAAAASAPSGPMLIAETAPYTITFNKNDGTTPPTTETKQTGADGKLTGWPANPTRTDYEFAGWFTAATGGTKIEDADKDTPFTVSTTLYAHWEPVVTFYGNGGLMIDGTNEATEVERTTTNGKLTVDRWPTPTRNGSAFLGWFTDPTAGTKVEPNAAHLFAGGDKLYAHWSSIEYTIIFDRNDGSGSTMKRTTKDGKVADMPANPVRDGYTFAGWHTAKEGGSEVTSSYPFGENTTVYAHWTKDIVVTFDANGGKFADGKTTVDITADKGGYFTEKWPADPIYGGHVKLGWFDAPENGNEYTVNDKFTVDTPTKLYAQWRVQEYTIKWAIREVVTKDDGTTEEKDVTDANLKSIPDTTTVGGKIPNIPQLTRPGFLFDGWKVTTGGGSAADVTKVTEDTIFSNDATLTSQWEKIEPVTPPKDGKEITFIVDVPTELPDAAHFVLYTDANGRLQHQPKLVGRDHDGWREKNGTSAVPLGQVYGRDTDLYINVAQTITVTFDWNNAKDGGTSSKTTVRTDKDGKIPEDKWPDALAPDKNPGYQFDGWHTDPKENTPVSKLKVFTEATTIYAHWKGPFTITFDANGGEFPDKTTTKSVQTDDDGNLDPLKVAAEVPTPTREGYTKFGGWSRTKDGTEAVEPDAEPYTGAATLYAIWGPPYAIKFDPMGGEVTPTETMSTEDGKYPELPVPTHPRDTFAGWYTTKDYQEGTLVAAGGACTGAVTLYAKWTREPPFTITFVANQEGATMEDPTTGSAVATLTLKTDDKGVLMQAPPEPTLRGGKFQGWYTKQEEGTGELYADAATRTYTDDMTLYAHWDTMEFKITFDFNLQAINKDLNITTYTTTKSKSLTFLPGALPQAASGDYQIKGWYRVPNPVDGKDSPVTTSDTFDRDTTLYAQWERATNLPIVFRYPNITFMNEDGSAAMVTLEVDKDYKLAVIPEPPYKAGYNFKPDGEGWVTHTPDGKVDQTLKEILAAGPITGNLVVYPQYTSNGFTITFEPGEESELDPIKVTTTAEGRIPDGSMPSPTWEGHTLTGWYTSASGGTRITRRTVFTQDTTVYAHWDEGSGPDNPDDPNNPDNPTGPTSPPFTITFNPNGGNLNANTTALTDLNGRLMALPTPARTGYSFDGWFNGNERVTTATVFTANTTINAQWSTGSGGGSGSGSGDINGYAITVSNTTGGRVSVSTTYAREGDRVTVTVRPYSGYQLDRIDVTNARGYDVALREEGGNRYVFYMPASRVTVDAVFMDLIANSNNGNNSGNTGNNGNSGSTGGNTGWNPGGSGTGTNPSGGATSGMGIFSQPVLNTVPMPYLDVYPSDWYYSSVDYMWQRQLMGGVSSNRFGPQATTSNAMVWTILARLAGVDVTAGASAWYENARSWAVSNRISDGVGPNSAVTREQLATMLWNFKGSPAVGYDLGQFGDRGQISTYQAECALRWAVANNIVTGTANRLNPRGTATRAEVAAMITRFCQNT